MPLPWNDQSSKLKAVNHQIHTGKLLSVNFQNNVAFKETRTYVRLSIGGSASILDLPILCNCQNVQLPILVNIIVSLATFDPKFVDEAYVPGIYVPEIYLPVI